MSTKYFTVDAALLEELGERLIGRRHIALAELVKNSYDADAYLCSVKITSDEIIVTDNGIGMDVDTFVSYYLRLAAQHKRELEFSPELHRRLTGSKGVGRLAAQFLGSTLIVETARKNSRRKAVRAVLDWTKIQRGQDLQRFPVDVTEVDRDAMAPFADGKRYGTRIKIKNLKLEFGETEIEDLGRELWALRSPFERISSRTREKDPRDFDIELDAGIDEAEERFDRVISDLTDYVWRAKISGVVADGRVTDRAAISIEFTAGYPTGSPARTYREEISLSSLKWKSGRGEAGVVSQRALLDRAEFTIYVYKLENKQRANVPLEELKDYLEKFGSVSLYDAGFRLPYYGIDNDWLLNGADHARRLSTSSLLPSKWDIDDRYMLDLPEPRRLFGYAEISTNHEASVARRQGARPGQWLEIQSGRDRLVDNLAHQQLQALVRYSLDLYANRYRARHVKSVEVARGTEPANRKYSRLRQTLEESRDIIPETAFKALHAEAVDAEATAAASEDLFDARTAAIAPLAAAGMTALGMSHELSREARHLERARQKLMKLARKHGLSELEEIGNELGGSLARLRSLQSLFTPLLSEEDREGSDRLRALPIVRQISNAMGTITPGMSIELQIEDELRFPAAPLAAWNAILQNVIANAWNASLGSNESEVRIESWREDGWEGLMVSDKGCGVDAANSERLFDAFERDLKVAPEHAGVAIGGQGLGLAIVKMLSTNYGAEAWFEEEPVAGFATTFAIGWKC